MNYLYNMEMQQRKEKVRMHLYQSQKSFTFPEALLLFTFICFFPQLEQHRQKDAEREEQTTVHHTVVAMKEVDELSIIHLWHEVEHEVSHTIVYPMQDKTWKDTIRTTIQPTQQQTDNKSMQTLC